MFDRRHPLGWLFYLLLTAAVSSAQTSPTTTTVSDTVFRADGTSWRHAFDFMADIQYSSGAVCGGGKKERDPGDGWRVIGALVPNATVPSIRSCST